ncbi:hypothetical protein [Streptomyces aidingensis]|uniref:Tetratricopeptide repeat-containing protein n=1 Tax=Streptomyces aidingensis TaxID=910347 RepID=A0A1I1NZT6_9ACTN|nr:hypothetical protein [Streptomyces aidingensis]SFD03089.1 hypothetical protein SAMN05421773_108254 [Streptomyces aidingensis]
MRGKLLYALLAVVLTGYFVMVGHRGVLLVREAEPVSVALGLAVLVLPLLGAWFLWHSTRFALRAEKLVRALDAEGGLPVDDLPRTPAGRIDQQAADEAFARYRAETEASPGDWRCWARLAIAYHDARDTPRARKAMQHAITLRGRGSRSGRVAAQG